MRLGSFNAAAKALHRVPSAISYAVKMLEEDLGLALFDRTTYRPQLTMAGQAIYRKVQMVLGEMEELGDLAKKMAIGQEPLVRLDISPICPLWLYTPTLRHIAVTFPHTQLKISMEIFGGDSLVLHREVDLSLTDQLTTHPELESKPFAAIPMVAAVASDHALAGRAGLLTKRDLISHFQIVVRSQSDRMRERSFGIVDGGQTWMVNDFPTKHQLIKAGLGWGHLPQTMIQADLDSGSMVQIQMDFLPTVTAKLRLVRSRAEIHGPVLTRLWDLLGQAGSSVPDTSTAV